MWHDRNEKGFQNQTGLFCATKKKMVIFTYYQPHGGLHCISTLVSSNNLNLLPLFHRWWRLLQLWREWPLCPGMSRGRGWETRKRTRGREEETATIIGSRDTDFGEGCMPNETHPKFPSWWNGTRSPHWIKDDDCNLEICFHPPPWWNGTWSVKWRKDVNGLSQCKNYFVVWMLNESRAKTFIASFAVLRRFCIVPALSSGFEASASYCKFCNVEQSWKLLYIKIIAI